MRIKEYIFKSNSGNNFKAVFECERCGHSYEAIGYPNINFYDTVPNAICPKCGLNSKGETKEQLKKRVGTLYVIEGE